MCNCTETKARGAPREARVKCDRTRRRDGEPSTAKSVEFGASGNGATACGCAAAHSARLPLRAMRFLLCFSAAAVTELCHAELDALLQHDGLRPRDVYGRDPRRASPFLVVELPDAATAARTLGRAVCVKYYVLLWTEEGCTSLHGAVASVARYGRSGVVTPEVRRRRSDSRGSGDGMRRPTPAPRRAAPRAHAMHPAPLPTGGGVQLVPQSHGCRRADA